MFYVGVFTAIVNIKVPKVNNRWIIFVVLCTLALNEEGPKAEKIILGTIFVIILLFIRRKGYILDKDWGKLNLDERKAFITEKIYCGEKLSYEEHCFRSEYGLIPTKEDCITIKNKESSKKSISQKINTLLQNIIKDKNLEELSALNKGITVIVKGSGKKETIKKEDWEEIIKLGNEDKFEIIEEEIVTIDQKRRSNTDDVIINKKELINEITDCEIRVKERSTGKIINIKRSEWKKSVENGEQNMYEVLYN